MSDDAPSLSVDEFVDYCRTQAGLLSGQVQTMGDEADELLDEIDEEMAEIRTRLGERGVGPTTPSSTERPTGDEIDLEAIEELQRDLEEKQLLVEAKQARMQAFQDLAAGYTDLATELDAVEDGHDAMERVVRFEADHDAPAYFDERQTMYEAAAKSDDSSGPSPDVE
ncbi:hypothetical protein [Natrialba swarupiae]|uniref:Uncharacterized protein n=1 Tax=Natrialba swarupiae TaxID=2448032 RepID=A0A5D5AS84_9EURY|nr:hypothetical protein [Natrialba swarupiae]TYT62360.1 hypothetical protein FYC77_09080 [Natrialba swarupiae]